MAILYGVCDTLSKVDGTPQHAMSSETDPPQFLLHNEALQIQGVGKFASLPRGNAATFAERVRSFFQDRVEGPPVLLGAVPFDPRREDYLYQPATYREVAPSRDPGVSPGVPFATPGETPGPRLNHTVVDKLRSGSVLGNFDTIHLPTGTQYKEAVRSGIERLAMSSPPLQEKLEKIVLARSLIFEGEHAISPIELLARLPNDPQATTFLTPLPATDGDEPVWLAGATPELLISRRGLEITSHPLAGSAPRSANTEEDRSLAEALLTSEKDRDEHRFVVQAIEKALRPFCCQLNIPREPSLLPTATMWHLGTRITGKLNDPKIDISQLVATLHPTPALCGTPRESALETILELEPFDRKFYGGAIGWINDRGDGDWYVTIRCAEVRGKTIQLFAGAGIVSDSVPEIELEETSAKFRTWFEALGIANVERNSFR